MYYVNWVHPSSNNYIYIFTPYRTRIAFHLTPYRSSVIRSKQSPRTRQHALQRPFYQPTQFYLTHSPRLSSLPPNFAFLPHTSFALYQPTHTIVPPITPLLFILPLCSATHAYIYLAQATFASRTHFTYLSFVDFCRFTSHTHTHTHTHNRTYFLAPPPPSSQ